MHFAYLVRCADGTYYAGYTRDLAAREARHNQGTQALAMAREHELKRLTRRQKDALVRARSQWDKCGAPP